MKRPLHSNPKPSRQHDPVIVETIEDFKRSFAPLTFPDIEILILGSLPGDRSLELNEYYGHPHNKFWRMIADITRSEIPLNYSAKKMLLRKKKIGLWDITQHAVRKGSLDSAIKDEQPNDLMGFIAKHKKLKVIAFNGKKAEALYNKYFDRVPGITYLVMPSTSPANAGISFDRLCETWKQILLKE